MNHVANRDYQSALDFQHAVVRRIVKNRQGTEGIQRIGMNRRVRTRKVFALENRSEKQVNRDSYLALNLSEVGQKSIKVADLESRHGIRVCAFERADGTVSSIPSPSSILYHGDAVLAVVSHAMLPAIAKYAQD